MIIDFDSKNKGGGGKEPVVEALSVTENGIYNAPSGVDGFTPVDVNVPSREPVLESLSITDNGTYTPSAGKDGFDSVDVNVPKEHHNVTSKSITANGVYNSTGDEVWNEVSVNVPQKTFNKASVTKEYTSNGQYSIATPDGYDGISDVNLTVNVASSGGGGKFGTGLTLLRIFTNAETIDFSNLDTSTFTSMENMFSDKSSLTSLDLSSFNTSNVTNMRCMFYGCDALTSLDLSSFDTSKVTNMALMFYDCNKLTSLDLSGFNTSNVTNMINMFYRCMSLETIKCDGLQLPDINMLYISFDSCSKLTVDSIVGLLNALPQSTHNYSFQIGQTNIDKLSDDQKAIATNKGWTLV